MNSLEEIRQTVKTKYGEAAAKISAGQGGCCGDAADPTTGNLYDANQAAGIPEQALLASFGCGNPTALAQLRPGEIVLDLGSGGGIDVLLSAKRVGALGKAYGLDMTDEMLNLAKENQQRAGVDNVEFLKGEIEAIPLPDESVDVVISNCVINLSGDKDKVLAEAFRVLKPGGRFAVADVVVRGEVPAEIRRNMELWVGCVAGALEAVEYEDKLKQAGFENVSLEPTRVYTASDAREFLEGSGLDVAGFAEAVDGRIASMFVRAIKPGEARTPVQVEVFDPAMCCSTGVCGPAPNPVLPRFAADLDWLHSQGVTVRRYNLSQEPAAFAANDKVKAALAEQGTESLPMILVNGEPVSQGKYPVRFTLAKWAGLPSSTPPLELPILDSGKTGCC